MRDNFLKRRIHTKIGMILCPVALLLTGMIAVIMTITGNYEESRIFLTKKAVQSTDWRIEGEPMNSDGSRNRIHVEAGVPIHIIGRVPENVNDEWGAMLNSDYCAVQVYVESEQVYSFGTEQPLSFGQLLGDIRLVVPLNSSHAGKIMRIIMTPYYTSGMDVRPPRFEVIPTLYNIVLVENTPQLLFVAIMFVLQLVCIVFLIFQKKAKSDVNHDSVYYFILFLTGSITWTLCGFDLLQFVTNSYASVAYAYFMSIPIMSVAFSGFCSTFLSSGKHAFRMLWSYGWLIPIISSLCYVFGVCDPVHIIWLTHIHLALNFILALVYAIKDGRFNKRLYLIVAAMGTMGLCVLIGFVTKLLYTLERYSAFFFGLGVSVFLIILSVLLIENQFGRLEERKYLEIYKNLTSIDVMTNMRNRMAFTTDYTSVTKEDFGEKYLTLFVFKLMHLRDLNASEGQQAGDMLIIGLGECISRIFKAYGECYRIGSDEFAVYMKGKEGQQVGLLRDFDESIVHYNGTHKLPISVAYGFESGEYEQSDECMKVLWNGAYQKLRQMEDNIM